MELILSILVGVLFAAALYTMLRRSIVRLAIGLTLLSHAANLLIFTVSGVSRRDPPIVEEGEQAPIAGFGRPGAAGAHPDRHRHQLRRARVPARAREARLPDGGKRRHRHDGLDRAMNVLLVLPLLVPLFAAALAMLAWRRVAVQRWIGVAGALGQLVAGASCSCSRCARAGSRRPSSATGRRRSGSPSWPTCSAPIMVVITGLMGLAVAIYSFGGLDTRRESYGYYPLLLILLVGVCGAFLTGDIFNLFVWFEVMLIASFVLLALGGERPQLEGAIKYVTINLVSSAFFLSGRRHPLRPDRHAEHGRPGRPAARARPAGDDHHGRDAPPRRVRHQGRDLPALLLAAGELPHAAGGGQRHLRRAAHEGRRLRAHPRLHAPVRRRRGLHPHPDHGHRRADDGRRRARGGGPARGATDPQLPHRQPDRLHDHGARAVHRRRRWPHRSSTSSTTSS
jgi:hypothetical protein